MWAAHWLCAAHVSHVAECEKSCIYNSHTELLSYLHTDLVQRMCPTQQSVKRAASTIHTLNFWVTCTLTLWSACVPRSRVWKEPHLQLSTIHTLNFWATCTLTLCSACVRRSWVKSAASPIHTLNFWATCTLTLCSACVPRSRVWKELHLQFTHWTFELPAH